MLVAKRFRVRNYRSIDDSGPIELDRVTAFLGRNESGKTSLLRALHKFNPAKEEPYNPQREFPRDRFRRDYDPKKKIPVCTVEFGFTPDGKAAFEEEVGVPPPERAVCTRHYDGSLDVSFEPPIQAEPVSADAVREALDKLDKAVRRLSAATPEQEEAFQARKSGLLDWSTKKAAGLKPGVDLRGEKGQSILQTLVSEANAHSSAETADAIEQLVDTLKSLVQEAGEDSPEDLAAAFVEEHLPVFIYFENYGILDSAVYLPRFLEDLSAHPNDGRVRTLQAMFRQVRLDPKEITELGAETARQNGQAPTPDQIARDQERKENRAIQLSSASNDISSSFSAWWSQRRHSIRYDVDGNYFRIWVSDDRRPNVEIELEARSKGFQWFFSFYLVFLDESDDGHKNAILLLDEPALHLHPTAQQEMIAFFEKLSEKNQLLYTTHSPFLIDEKNLGRVRPVLEEADGHSRVTQGVWPSDYETIFPLRAAAGYAMIEELFRHKKSLLVEGMTDHYYLMTLSAACSKAGKPALPDGAFVVPCSGTKSVTYAASLFLGREIRPLILFDGDDAGLRERDALLKELYKGHDRSTVVLSEVIGQPGAQVEDLFDQAVVVQAVADEFGLSVIPDPGRSVVDLVKDAARQQGVPLPKDWKSHVALRVSRGWTEGRITVSEDTLTKASKLFADLQARWQQQS